MYKTPPVSVLSKEIVSPNNQRCDNFEDAFSLLRIIGEGGGGYIIEAIANKDIEVGIKYKQKVAIKLCKGDILDIVGCNEYVKEANIMRKTTLLNSKGICYNFPIYYMYGKCCLFYRKGQFRDIDEKLPESCNLPYDKVEHQLFKTKRYVVPDLLIHYANRDLPDMTVRKTVAMYGDTCMKDIKGLFQLDNFQVLGKKWDINPDRPNVDDHHIYDFIVGDSDVNCGNYIVMSLIEGSALDTLGSDYLMDPNLIFDMMYSNACLIKHYGFLIADRHDDNVMIGNIDMPRIYKLGEYYLLFNTSQMYYSIDLQATIDTKFIDIKTLITVGRNHISESMLNIIDTLAKNKYTLDELMIQVLPQVYRNYIITDSEVKQLLAKTPNILIAEYK